MDLVKKGKNIIITIIVALILLDIISSSSVFLLYPGSKDALTIIIRLMLECLLYYFLYRGYRWAKVLITILMISAGALSVITSITLLGSPVGLIISLMLGVLFIGIGITLVRSKTVNTFFSYQREKSESSVMVEAYKQEESTDTKNS